MVSRPKRGWGERCQDSPGGSLRGGGTFFPPEVSGLWDIWKWEEEVGGGETEGEREVAAGM